MNIFTLRPLSTNANLNIGTLGNVFGDVHCRTKTGLGLIVGIATTGAAAKYLPLSITTDAYIAMAKQLSATTNINKQILTPTLNTIGGGLNPDGCYYLHSSGKDVALKASRVHGTLIVECKTLTLSDAVFLKSFRADYPALIVLGDLVMAYQSADHGLSEATLGTNFNPVNAEFEGVADADLVDVYPNEVQGLVHVTKDLFMRETALVRGAVICEHDVSCEAANRIIHLASLYQGGVFLYDSPGPLEIVKGTRQQDVD